jgi:hypothetical protein
VRPGQNRKRCTYICLDTREALFYSPSIQNYFVDEKGVPGGRTVKIKQVGSELSVWFKQVFRMKNWWILLPGLCAVVLVYVVQHFDIYPWLATKIFHETLAPWLVGAVFLILLTTSLISRDSLMIFLVVLALVFLVRELNATTFSLFGGEYLFKSKKLVDCLLVGMGLWAIGWHEKLFDCFNRSILLKALLSGSLWTYFFSQLIARRVFRGVLPEERLLHVPLEETVETAAHLFFLVFAVFCLFYFSIRKTARVQTVSPTVEPKVPSG